MKCFIIRHANKEKGNFFNPKLKHQDQPISQIGIEQSKWLQYYFKKIYVDAIFISEYLRAAQTVKYIAESKSIQPEIDSRLNELDNGLIEGMGEGELKGKYPKIWKAFKKRNRDFKFPEGESGKEAQQRIVSFLNDQRSSYVDQTILVVSHDGLIRTLMCHIMGRPVYDRWNFKVDNCGITEMDYLPDYDTWKLTRFNQVN